MRLTSCSWFNWRKWEMDELRDSNTQPQSCTNDLKASMSPGKEPLFPVTTELKADLKSHSVSDRLTTKWIPNLSGSTIKVRALLGMK